MSVIRILATFARFKSTNHHFNPALRDFVSLNKSTTQKNERYP